MRIHKMANYKNYNYGNFDSPYDKLLDRKDTLPSSSIEADYGDDLVTSPVGLGENVIDGQSIGNFYIRNWIKSQNYKPKKQGFLIHGELGYIECMKLYVGAGGMIGGSLDIPDTINPDSFHVAPDGTTWWGANNAAGYLMAPAFITPEGDAMFNSVLINGRDGQTLADAINADGDLVNDVINSKLDTDAKQILGEFTFSSLGAIKMATDSNNGVWISPTGILGKKSGVPSFTITTSGDATFAGELSAAFGTFGTITAGTLKGSLVLGNGTTTAVTVGNSINAAGNFISDLVNSKMNTSAKTILADFDFGSVDYAGAVKSGNLTWNTSGVITGGSGVAIYRKGIVGAAGGVVTFSIDATTGAAYFKGAIGSATSMDAPVITGGTMTGATVRAGTYDTDYMELGTTVLGEPYLRGFIDAARRVQLDNNSLEFFNASSLKTMDLTESGFTTYGAGGGSYVGKITSVTGSFIIEAPYGQYMQVKVGHSTDTGIAFPLVFMSVDEHTGDEDQLGMIFMRGGSEPTLDFRYGTMISNANWTRGYLYIGENDPEVDPTAYIYIGGAGDGMLRVRDIEGSERLIGGSAPRQESASYELVLGDHGALINMSSGSALTVTIPHNDDVPFPEGAQIDFLQGDTGTVSFVGASGVTIRSKGSAVSMAAQYSGATLIKVSTNVWFLVGDLA